MNLKTIRIKNQTGVFSLSFTKYCETLMKETHRKAEETIEFKKIKSRKTSHFTSPINGDWMLGLTSQEVYISFYNITEENNKFEL